MSAAIGRAADASELFVAEGIERVMNVFNGPEPDREAPSGDGPRGTTTQDPDPAA